MSPADIERAVRNLLDDINRRLGIQTDKKKANVQIGFELVLMLSKIDTAVLSTADSMCQPNLQYFRERPGFIKSLNSTTLGFSGRPDQATIHNLSENGFFCLLLIDRMEDTFVKMWGRALVISDHPELVSLLAEGASQEQEAIVLLLERWERPSKSGGGS
jgi:uncharacterized protein